MGRIRLLALLFASALFVNLCSQTVLRAAGMRRKTENKDISAVSEEYRAFWFSFYDYDTYRAEYKKPDASNFKSYFNGVLKKGKNLGMNRIIVHVRPFGDALYKSEYFPWSSYISGTQGKDPGFDPLEIMVSSAHENGMKIEAWINPYRVTLNSADYGKLSIDNPARKWHEGKSTKRNVLSYGGSLYYNPSKKEVRELITSGVREIVENYDVDGIHMDDYFYPSFTKENVNTAFDAREYNESEEKRQGKDIYTYRCGQVNSLVRQIKETIRETDSSVVYGISPAGNFETLTSRYAYYVDIYRWLSSNAYVDYICPQIYWGFKHPTASFDRVTDQWVKACKKSPVKLYLGIGVYRAGHDEGDSLEEQKEWKSDADVLKNQVEYGRKKQVDGFAFFDYRDLAGKTAKKAVERLTEALKTESY